MMENKKILATKNINETLSVFNKEIEEIIYKRNDLSLLALKYNLIDARDKFLYLMTPYGNDGRGLRPESERFKSKT